MSAPLYDAHNHLQSPKLAPHLESIAKQLTDLNVAKVVVNGTQESDWEAVLELARRNSKVIPSFGLHPWQEEAFLWQLRVAAERNLPVSVHCLRAWGRLLELLQAGSRPECGFLIHSYGGPQEMIAPLAKLGAYFSISGYFAQERKVKQQEVFRHVPPDRLLIETDAPDMLPPASYIDFPIDGTDSEKPINNPANIGAVYRFVTKLLQEPEELVRERTEENFKRLFGSLLR